MPLYLNLIGEPGSGKSTVAQHLAVAHEFSVFRPSDAIRDYALELGEPLTVRADYLAVHQKMLANDPDYMVDAALATSSEKVCIDGMRVPAHIDALNTRLKSVHGIGMFTLALECPEYVRYTRVKERAAHPDKEQARSSQELVGTFEDFLSDCAVDNLGQLPDEANVRTVMATADRTIDSYCLRSTLLLDVDRLVPKIPDILENRDRL